MQKVTRCDAIIVGAGITGIAAAYYLKKKNIDFVLLEKNHDVGGTWLKFRWHGIRADSSAQTYAYRFRPVVTDKSFWSGEAIHRYLAETVEECGLNPFIRYNVRVTAARFSAEDKNWTVATDEGEFRAPFLINSNGYYSDTPHRPRLNDESLFAGDVISSSDLDPSLHHLEGKRVVIVGSGSTAITMAPQIAEIARSVTLIQRSPGYYVEMPTEADSLSKIADRLYGAGIAWPKKMDHWRTMIMSDVIWLFCRAAPNMMRRRIMRDWEKYVSAEQIEGTFSPSYNPWEQRICVSTGFWPAVKAQKIDVITDEIAACRKQGIRLKSDRSIDCDWIILATGIDLEFLKFPLRIDHADLVSTDHKYIGGLMLERVPNYFHPAGYWHTSWTLRIEALAQYVSEAIAYTLAKGLREIRVKPTARKGVMPPLKANYILRGRQSTPLSSGGAGLASVDRLFNLRFSPRKHIFGR